MEPMDAAREDVCLESIGQKSMENWPARCALLDGLWSKKRYINGLNDINDNKFDSVMELHKWAKWLELIV